MGHGKDAHQPVSAVQLDHGEDTRRLLVTLISIFYDKSLKSVTKEDYLAVVDKVVALERYSDFSPSLLAVINKATDIKRWPLLYRSPAPTWRKRRIVLTGDAAHPMLLHQGQGGAQALEDGCAYGIVLHGACTPVEIEKRLELYEEIRRHRASTIQILSNAGQDQAHLITKSSRSAWMKTTFPVMKEYDGSYEPPAALVGGGSEDQVATIAA
ncbi:hypothetical protein B0T17DRAFT_505039 [Bombardia bombarda]|uniref:FAD-binding domain-containing protein n=1 Tax=Bombardia bombarda TaxID=252184 RepID=A0AA40C7F9_9PEZI|nr:hypothetical protein B0T17DRAFT_505039 [Bombardia bombarda]